ncbi:MAG TPA: polysaccharide deacetylase family protein [Steroidobacteraceae bacterium]|nr:polysaccharide deacetylase family protein [Steroidobacteraceae bacterium]
MRSRYVPSPLIRASIALHLGAGAALLARPQSWPFALGALVADHLLLSTAGLWPQSRLLGPNWTRLPAASAKLGHVAITIDDGPDPEVTPRVLSILQQYGASATFFCVGRRVERHAALALDIAHRGHAIENHGYRHTKAFSLLGPKMIYAEISRGQDSIAAACGDRPRFFRAPAGLRNPFLEPVLTKLQLRLVSWSRRGFDTVNRHPDDVLRRLTGALRGGDILLLHDGNAARSARGVPVILEVLPRLLETLRARNLEPITLRSALADP